VTLAGDTTIGGTARWDIRGPSASLLTGGQPHKLTKVGTNHVSLVGVDTVDPALGDIDIVQGVLAFQTTTAQMGDPSKTITLFPGAILNVWNLNAHPLDKLLVLQDGATVWNESGSSAIVGPVTLTNGTAVFNVGGASLTFSNVLTGPGGLIKIGAGQLKLFAANTYSGNTLVNEGVLSLIGPGAISGSPVIRIESGATLDVSGRTDGILGLSADQSLQGNGMVNGSVTVGPTASLAPGTSIGALTVTNVVTLQGTTFIELDKAAGTNDVIRGAATIHFGGTLVLTNLGGTLAPGDIFKLFYANNCTGAFDHFNPPEPAPGLLWDSSELIASGTLQVAAAPLPSISGATISGTNIVLNGTGGAADGTFLVLTSTNLSAPAGDWTPAATNLFNGDGEFNVSLPLAPDTPQLFYRIQVE